VTGTQLLTHSRLNQCSFDSVRVKMKCVNRRVLSVVFVVFCSTFLSALASLSADNSESLEDVVRTLRGQVNALLERRQEDFKILEESIRHSLNSNSVIADVRREVDMLRLVLQRFNTHTPPSGYWADILYCNVVRYKTKAIKLSPRLFCKQVQLSETTNNELLSFIIACSIL
jgi:hypothetical protein